VSFGTSLPGAPKYEIVLGVSTTRLDCNLKITEVSAVRQQVVRIFDIQIQTFTSLPSNPKLQILCWHNIKKSQTIFNLVHSNLLQALQHSHPLSFQLIPALSSITRITSVNHILTFNYDTIMSVTKRDTELIVLGFQCYDAQPKVSSFQLTSSDPPTL